MTVLAKSRCKSGNMCFQGLPVLLITVAEGMRVSCEKYNEIMK